MNLCLGAFVWFCIPETKAVSLEEIDVLFGGSNHVEKGGNMLQVDDAHHAEVRVDNVHVGRHTRRDDIIPSGHDGSVSRTQHLDEIKI